VPGDADFVLPFEHGARCELTAIVRDSGFWPAIEPDAPFEFRIVFLLATDSPFKCGTKLGSSQQ
jgi:hypothetical protein